MSFDPTKNYRTVTDLDGNVFVLQGGFYYDKFGNQFTLLPPSKEGFAAPAHAAGLDRLLGLLRGANFNSVLDQAIAIQDSTKYRLTKITIGNASTSLTTAVGGIYDSPNKAADVIVAAAQGYAALTSASQLMDAVLTSYTGQASSEATLYLSLTTAQGAPATADIFVYGRDL